MTDPVAQPSFDDGEPSPREILATFGKKELYGNFFLHVLIFIPGAVLLAYFALRVDRMWAWPPLPGMPWNLLIALACFAVGGCIVWYSYAYLFLKGKGSPGSHMGYTQQLVDSGIFSLVRHPSVVGKLVGVIGLAFLMRSPTFLVVFIPLLFLYSFLTTRLIQERFCIRNFGDAYRQYCREVPMYIPRWSRLRALLARGRDPQ